MATRDEDMIAEVDLMKDAVYRVMNGRLQKLDSPPTGFGKQVITWQDNKPSVWELSYTGK
ncbi:DUF3954 domain-containing protein [Planococcus sp. ANT_H30]|uniref:DUF3954 domain-containing protein n=1 Tax=Planococcus sp. ANT_H30 TaxID=2597347 RepID=UPI0011EE8128|nr:DUF3954 domain-containing protein [Planococcus sp. ANT_H30]KAA0956649.1 DUF3954 domain-containing protein [Planococcus sp. ANT_H30]